MAARSKIAKLEAVLAEALRTGTQADIDRAEQALVEAGGMDDDTPQRIAALHAAEGKRAAAAETEET